MTPERWRRVKHILNEALERGGDERAEFVHQACRDDVELRHQVEVLLESDRDTGEFLAPIDLLTNLTKPAESQIGVTGPELFTEIGIGRRIGQYEILREVGRGGMGAVYLACRADGQFRKRVAVKLAMPGIGIRDSLLRFQIERQVLAELDHANIARLLDGGTTEDDLPFLVMEYVEGAPIDRWCDARRLSVTDRLKLFRSVCAAVQYAHEKQILHRDIKPANILVTADGIPKLLDFGIAKILDPELCLRTLETSAGSRPMTPDFASPEQAKGQPLGPPSDVYSLGVVLYLLLTGRSPSPARMAGAAGEAGMISDREVMRPSVAIMAAERSDGIDKAMTIEPVSAARADTPAGLRRRLAGDLDTVVLMALREEPERRYASVSDFSEDVARVLEGRPIRARKESPLYNARKFLRRNRIPAALSASLAAVLLLALVTGLNLFKSYPAGSGVSKSLAVVQLENRTNDASLDWVGSGIRELLTTNLSDAEGVQVISSERVHELIGRRIDAEGLAQTKQLGEVAKEAQADLFLSGTLTKSRGRIRLDWRVNETATGKVRFAGVIETADVRGIPTMADQAAAAILSRLTSGRPQVKPNASALTRNVEALREYEQGLAGRARFENVATPKAFQRAIDLDPDFVMAHYYLAEWMWRSGDAPEARRIIARSAMLAEHVRIPRLQKLLLQALQLRVDLRLDEAAIILEAAHREFSREIEPLYELATIRGAEGRFAEAAILLEQATRMDERHALAHDQLGYFYALQGDVARGIESIDRYAELLPPGDVVPVCSRADIFLINEHYDEAIAQYRHIKYWIPLATAAAYAGDYALSGRTLDAHNVKKGSWYEAAGDLAAAGGQLARAAPYYEKAADSYRYPLRAWFASARVARIFQEQRQPTELLAFGQRHNGPWAAGWRGLAYLLLHQNAAAEREFEALRDSVTPILGDYVAGKMIEFHRMQAASYEGRFDQVIQMWPRLPGAFWSLYSLDVGRAYLQSGLFTEAEHHLRLARKGQLAFFWSTDMEAQHDFLGWMLAQFYLGQLLDKTGWQGQAAANYEAFLKHFEGSSAALPQIRQARGLLVRAPLSERGKLLVSDEFSSSALGPNWSTKEGTWELTGGVLTGSAPFGETASYSRALKYRDAIFEVSFRLEGRINLVLRNQSGGVCWLAVAPNRTRLLAPRRRAGARAETISDVASLIEPGVWHKLLLDVHGERIAVQIDGQPILVARSPFVNVDKTGFGLRASAGKSSFASLQIYEALRRRDNAAAHESARERKDSRIER